MKLPDNWKLPEGEERRQAIAPLRGYAYQLHQTVARWIDLPDNATLCLEIAEDYAAISRDPGKLDDVLTATQVKDTRESGSVTLNSEDVQEAIKNFWKLRETNLDRKVFLKFLTTSPIGRERKNSLGKKTKGLNLWKEAADNGNTEIVLLIRQALLVRFKTGNLHEFLRDSSDHDFREQLLQRITFDCGQADGRAIENASRAQLVARRDEVKATSQSAEKAYGLLLEHVLKTILDSPNRLLTRSDFLICFETATSIDLPSGVLVDLLEAAHNGLAWGKRDTRPLEVPELQDVARKLLSAGRPPSLLRLFPDASLSAVQALEELARLHRSATNTDPSRHRKAPIVELAKDNDLHHILMAPPGSGKTHALWYAADEMLNNGGMIPIFVPVGGMTAWDQVLQAVSDVCESSDAGAILRDRRVCVLLDGWSEFAPGSGVSERIKALRALSRSRVIANARRGSEYDNAFQTWELEPLPVSVVKKTIVTALPGTPLPDNTFIDLLRLPLALTLYLLLGGSAVARGELLDRLHSRLSQTLPENFRKVLASAAASLSLTGDRSYLRLQREIEERAQQASIAEPMKALFQLGTIADRGGTVAPIHDLYWSWLSGVGLLAEDCVELSIRDLTNRESYQLALESKARTVSSMVGAACPIDTVFAALLSSGLRADDSTDGNDILNKSLSEMFSDSRLPVRCRASLAALQSKRGDFLIPALEVFSELRISKLYVPSLHEALHPADLFPHRDSIADWIGSAGTDEFLDAIAAKGAPGWGAWLEQLTNSGKVSPLAAAAAAIACEGRVPPWTVPHLPALASQNPWKLRVAADRGANIELARWIAVNYGDHINQGSGWFHLNQVILNCGTDETFDYLLSHFNSLPKRAQESIEFAVVDKGDPWLARFQKIAFADGYELHHHKLTEAVSLDIDDVTARGWIANGPHELGWRVLIARHGTNVIPDLIAALPKSFNGVGDNTALSAMKYLVDPPDTLIGEIWDRFQGHIQPKIAQDAINALVRVKPNGIPSLIRMIESAPHGLPVYHFKMFIRYLKEWERDTGLKIKMKRAGEEITFSEWAIRQRLSRDVSDPFFSSMLAADADVATQLILVDLQNDEPTVKKILSEIKPLLSYHAKLAEYLSRRPNLVELIPKVFAHALDTFPESALTQAIDLAANNFDEFVRALAESSSPTHHNLHKLIVRKALNDGFNLFRFRDVAKMLRVHTRKRLIEMLKTEIAEITENALWLIREIEYGRRELLINEAGNWID